MRYAPAVVMLATAWFAAAPAHTAPTPVTLATVTVIASKALQPLEQVPATVSTVTREEIERRLVFGIADLLRYDPGVAVLEDAGRFGAQGYAIRGLDGNRVDIEIDGVPVADGFSIGSFSRAGRDAIDPELLERVDVLRGPASTLYGSDALAGVVAYRTRAPDDLLARVDDDDYVGARGAWSGREAAWLASATVAARHGDWSGLVSVARRNGRERENVPRPGGLAANPADTDDALGLTKWMWQGGEATLGLTAERARSTQTTDVRHLIAGPGQFATTTALDAHDAQTRERVSLNGEWPIASAGDLTLRAHLYAQNTELTQRTDQRRRGATPTQAPTQRLRRFDFDTAARGVELNAEARADWGRVRHWQVFGLEYTRTALNERRDGREINLNTGASTHVVLGEVLPVRDFPPSITHELGVFWQDELRWGDAPWAVIPGLRYEHYRVDAQPDALWLADNPRTPVADLSERRVTPRLALRYDVSERANLYAHYAVGFRAPPFSDVNIGFVLPGVNLIAKPNPALKSETARGVELGWRYHGERTQAHLAVYRNRYRDLIESRANLGLEPVSGAQVFQSINRDRATIEGAEASGAAELGRGFALHGALAYARGRDTVRDKPLNSIDPLRAVLGVRWTSANDQHEVELLVNAARRKSDIDESRGAIFHAPGYAAVDLLYQWRPDDTWQCELGLFNLGDQRYWQWNSVRNFSPSAREIDLLSQPGLSLGLSVSARW
jgi:hemoglobin/transferrin/lactoferrin receptor protein